MKESREKFWEEFRNETITVASVMKLDRYLDDLDQEIERLKRDSQLLEAALVLTLPKNGIEVSQMALEQTAVGQIETEFKGQQNGIIKISSRISGERQDQGESRQSDARPGDDPDVSDH